MNGNVLGYNTMIIIIQHSRTIILGQSCNNNNNNNTDNNNNKNDSNDNNNNNDNDNDNSIDNH